MKDSSVRVVADVATAGGEVLLLAGLSAVALSPLTSVPLLAVGASGALLSAAVASLRHWAKKLPDGGVSSPPSLRELMSEATARLSPAEEASAKMDACLALACWWAFGAAARAHLPSGDKLLVPARNYSAPTPMPGVGVDLSLVDVRLAWEHWSVRVLRSQYEEMLSWLFSGGDHADGAACRADWAANFYRELSAALAAEPTLARFATVLDSSGPITFEQIEASSAANVMSALQSPLPRVERLDASARIRGALHGHLSNRRARVVVLHGPAGVGKSTLLAGEFLRAKDRGARWAVFARFDGIALEVMRKGRALDDAVSESIGGGAVGLVKIVRTMQASRGSGLVFIDTLDTVLDEGTVGSIDRWFGDLVGAGAVVVTACRDVDFRAVAEPVGERLPIVANKLDIIPLPLFSEAEMREAALGFFVARGQSLGDAELAVKRISEVAVDRRHLFELFRVPLLLSMICVLFPTGDVPDDLTGVRLFDHYWTEIVEGARRRVPRSDRHIRSQFCVQVACTMLDTSGTTLVPAVLLEDVGRSTRDDLRILQSLESDGVLLADAHGRVGFFHQTLGEYALARHFETRAGKAQLISLLNRLAPHLQHLLPSVRVLLARSDTSNLHEVVRALDLDSLPTFRVVVQSYALRHDEELLDTVGAKATTRGGAWFRILCEVAGHGMPMHAPALASWGISVLAKLEYSDLLLAIPLITTAIVLARSTENEIAGYLGTLRLAAGRPWESNARKDEKISEALGQLIANLEGRKGLLSIEWIRPLANLFLTVPDRTRGKIVSVFLQQTWDGGLVAPYVSDWLERPMLRRDVPAAVQLLRRTWPTLVGASAQCLWPDPWSALQYRGSWSEIVAVVVAETAGREEPFVVRMLRTLGRDEDKFDRANLVTALATIISNGSGDLIGRELLAIEPNSLSARTSKALKPIVIRLLRDARGKQSSALYAWSLRLPALEPQQHVQFLAAFACSDPGARVELLNLAERVELSMGVVREVADWAGESDSQYLTDIASAVATVSPASRQWVQLADAVVRSGRDPTQIVAELLNVAVSGRLDVARDASRSLDRLVGPGASVLSVGQLLTMFRSPQPSVRLSAAATAVVVVQDGGAVTDEDVGVVLGMVACELIGNNIVKYLELLRVMVDERQTCGPMALRAVEDIVAGVDDKSRVHARVVREALVLLKRIAQHEPGTEHERVERLTVAILSGWDFQHVADAESEAMALVQAVCRMDRSAAARLCGIVAELPPRNAKSIVRGVARILGVEFLSLKALDHRGDVHPEVRATLTRLRELAGSGQPGRTSMGGS